MKATLTSINCFLCVVWLFATTSCTKTNCDPDVLGEVHLAAVLDLSGIYSEDRLAGKASIEMAISDLNQRYETVGSTTRFHCLFIDSKMDTSLVLSAVETLHNQGIRLLVGGPNTSAELNTIKNFMDSHSMLNLNCFSTAPSLAIAGDNIFRLIPDDNVKAQALTRMMQYDNIEGQLDIRRWQRNSEGQLLMEAVSDLGFPAGKVELSGVFSAGIQFDFSAVNDLFSDNGIVKRVSGEEIPVSKIAQVESSFIGDWDFNFGSGSKRCIDNNAVCGGWPELMPGFTSFVTIEDENASVNATTIFGWFEGPDPFTGFYATDIHSLIISQPYPYTDIEICGRISCISLDEWLSGSPFNVTYLYCPESQLSEGIYYYGDLNITPSDAKN